MKTLWDRLSYAIAAALFVLSVVLYPRLPEQIPTHWNIRGEIDGYGSKTWAAFLLPVIMILLIVVLHRLPVGNRSSEGESQNPAILSFITLLTTCLLGLLHGLSLAIALKYKVDFMRILMAGMFLFFGLMGTVLGRVKRNPWMGIRVPWTLESDRVWDATHKLGGVLFAVSGVVGAAMIVANIPLQWTPIPIALAALIPVVYSFLIRDRAGDGDPDGRKSTAGT